MKTVEEAQEDYVNNIFIEPDTYIGEIYDAFKAGYNFARQWQSIEDPPEYYVPVIVDLGDSGVIAWRAWSETDGDIYTINGTDVVLEEKPKRWRPI